MIFLIKKTPTMKLFITSILLCALIIGCKKEEKEEEKIPPQTQEGRNILSCKVNGVWHHYSGKGGHVVNDYGVHYDIMISKGILYTSIAAYDPKYDDYVEFEIHASPIEVGKVYDLLPEVDQHVILYILGGDRYKRAKESTGFVKFSRADSIAAGTFAFTAYNDKGEKVEITEGFFDIKQDK
jgi:hypothetical protein